MERCIRVIKQVNSGEFVQPSDAVVYKTVIFNFRLQQLACTFSTMIGAVLAFLLGEFLFPMPDTHTKQLAGKSKRITGL